MFAPPPVIDTEVFSALPDRWRDAARRSEWIEGQPAGSAGTR